MQPLLQIDHRSFKMFLLLLPPVYVCWMYSLAQFVAPDTKSKQLLSFLTVLLIVLTCFASLNFVIGLFTTSSLTSTTDPLMEVVFVLYWVFVCAVVGHYTLRYERRISMSEEQGRLSILDHLIRYFILANWWIGAWSMQKMINENYDIG